MNIPNILTLIRFFLVPVFIYSFYYQSENHYLIPLIIFVIAGITDVLDGYIARKYNLITKWGKLLDPLADKAMQLSALFVMTDKKIIPLWVILVVFAKELFLIIGGVFLYKKKIVVQANWYGKLATVMFFLAIITTVFIDVHYGMYLIIGAVVITLYAAIRYTFVYYRRHKALGEEETSISA